MTPFDLGDVRLWLLDAGRLWLDGGAMFGVVPKVLWERQRPADERNRIELAMNLLLVDDGKRRILIDTGAGTGWDERARDIYRLSARSPAEYLEAAGTTPEKIDVVVNTHFHFDHAGGNTVRNGSGALRATFPNARHVVQKGELETARWQNERTRAAYLPDHFEPLAAEGRLDLVEGEVALTPQLTVRPVPGHTPALQMAVVRAGGRTVAYLTDLVPTASHVPYAYIMGYDLEPLVTLATKKEILPRAAREGWIVVFEHDARVPWGVLYEDRPGKLTARPFEEA